MEKKNEPTMFRVDVEALFGAIGKMYESKDPNASVKLSDYATPVEN